MYQFISNNVYCLITYLNLVRDVIYIEKSYEMTILRIISTLDIIFGFLNKFYNCILNDKSFIKYFGNYIGLNLKPLNVTMIFNSFKTV